jgi:hypothetical protein
MALSEGDRSAGEAGGLQKLGEALIAPALVVPRAIAATVDQVVVAWEAVRAIPEIRDSLASIMTDTRTMTDEVTSMRQGVDKLDGNMNDLTGTVDVLGDRLEDVGKVVRPLKRIGDRLRAPAGTGPVPDVEDAVADAAAE